VKKKKDPIPKLVIGNQRENQKDQGFFDSRFVERTQESKKIYKRKDKHKTNESNDED
jgi:hypothetical protein